ncbi:MAG: basic rane protein [Actinomycetota bacterium]|jgi:basic membrane protein A|nr:basic rane protein [Actinomycetota bacterium]
MSSKFLSAVVVLAASSILLAGCAAAPPKSAGGTAKSGFCGAMVTDSGGLQDRSFNQSSWAGMQKAAKDNNIKVHVLVSGSDADLAPNVEAAANTNCGFVLTVGYSLTAATVKQAKAHPKTDFAIVDDVASAPNIKPIVFDTAQAAYLAGYLAAGVSKTGKVATFGGGNQPPVTLFMDGFVDGVAKYNSVHGTKVVALGWNKATQDGAFTGDFEDLSKGKALAATLIDKGADVILPVAGQVGQGAAAAAKDAKNVSLIWVDNDGYNTLPAEFRPLLLTSVQKNTGEAVAETVKSALDKTFTNTQFIGTLKNGGVSIAPFHDKASLVSAKLSAEVDALRKQIESGALVVTSPSTPKS